MYPARRYLPLWIALAVVAVVLASSYATRPADEPGPTTRAYVRTQLDVATGIQMVLPVELPAGYDHGLMYDYESRDTEDEGTATYDEDLTDPYATDDQAPWYADSRSVVFSPTGKDARLPIVVVCVQPLRTKHEFCPALSDSRHLQVRHEQTRVAIYAASRDSYHLSTWQSVALTTDLDRVRWLH